MNQEIINVYFMPGMAASSKIFEYIKLPEETFKIHYLEWIIPLDEELLSDYAIRLAKQIKHQNIVLLGVSFGGVLVQEMSKHVSVRNLIIVSSVKSMYELPKRMVMAKKTKAYKLLPTRLINNVEAFSQFAFGAKVNKRLELYKKYLTVNNKAYLNWAIKNMLCWNQEESLPGIIHIHGDKDPVFPIKNIKNCITVKSGTHIMIINKYKWFNENLPKIIIDK